MSGMDAIKFRKDMTPKSYERTLTVYQRELGPGFGWVCFNAGVTVPDAKRMYAADPASVGKISELFEALWESCRAEQ